MVYDIMYAPNHIIIGNKFLCTQYYKDTGGKGLYAHKYNITNIVIARKWIARYMNLLNCKTTVWYKYN